MNAILLNGPSSAGKSTIARELRARLDARGPVRVIALDDYLPMSPDEPVWEDDVFDVTPAMCADIAAALQRGCCVIIDHAITSARIYAALCAALAPHGCLKVLVSCGAEQLLARERARGDRYPGSAEASLRCLYPREGYDLRIDSGALSPGEAAALIAACMGLTVRAMREGDLEPLHALLSDPEVMRYLEPPFTRARTAEFLRDAGLAEPPLVYAVDDAAGRFIGYAIYHGYDARSVEIGWVLMRCAWGRGCAQALTALMIERARREGKDAVIECAPGQAVSAHIARKNGFAYRGRADGCDVYRLALGHAEPGRQE